VPGNDIFQTLTGVNKSAGLLNTDLNNMNNGMNNTNNGMNNNMNNINMNDNSGMSMNNLSHNINVNMSDVNDLNGSTSLNASHNSGSGLFNGSGSRAHNTSWNPNNMSASFGTNPSFNSAFGNRKFNMNGIW
jgi:hypothetical protein